MDDNTDSCVSDLRHAVQTLQDYLSHQQKPICYARNTPTSKRGVKENIPRLDPHYEPMHDVSSTWARAMQAAIKEATSTPMGLPMTLTPDEKQFIIDTGASITIRHSSEDLISPISSVQHTELKGITLGLTVQGMVTVAYTFWADDGTIFSLTLPNTLYVPNLPIRLIFPRHAAEVSQCEGDGFNSMHPTGTFTCHGHKITIPYHHSTGLPLLQSAPGITTYHNFLTQIHDTSKTNSRSYPHQSNTITVHQTYSA
jgi:hypothetical protein